MTTIVWMLAVWISSLWRRRASAAELRRAAGHRQSTQRMGVTMTPTLRDRLRPRWLRVRR
ncbi:MAG: hypothetical protein HRU75_13765 [Planctomycetia bacterium]|nr:MAG: hypothetical protein HRU75_13765 [Planctomycetia bacterium]